MAAFAVWAGVPEPTRHEGSTNEPAASDGESGPESEVRGNPTSATIYRPGQTVPVSCQYAVVDGRGSTQGALGHIEVARKRAK